MNNRLATEVVEVRDDPLSECLSSAFGATQRGRRTERAIFEKKPSTRLSQEPCFDVNTKLKRPSRWAASHALSQQKLVGKRVSSRHVRCGSLRIAATSFMGSSLYSQRTM
jgi:hypothetical protein